ncbi:Hypothetical protein CINCED_3A022421 [Cinara cedri]|uniref:Uncharacterized protein n=1 Tax=Cinara cedri TaxID=506608 RepID=A0A5E4NJ84_9HEMI|nr:Hypothetical protein CINCED_3A022421 [Cinara cedri]
MTTESFLKSLPIVSPTFHHQVWLPSLTLSLELTYPIHCLSASSPLIIPLEDDSKRSLRSGSGKRSQGVPAKGSQETSLERTLAFCKSISQLLNTKFTKPTAKVD